MALRASVASMKKNIRANENKKEKINVLFPRLHNFILFNEPEKVPNIFFNLSSMC